MIFQLLSPCSLWWGEDEEDEEDEVRKKKKQQKSRIRVNVNVGGESKDKQGRSAKGGTVKVKTNADGELEISTGGSNKTPRKALSEEGEQASKKYKKRKKKSGGFKWWWNDDDSDDEETSKKSKKRTKKSRGFKWWWNDDDSDDEEDEDGSSSSSSSDDDDENSDDDDIAQAKPRLRAWLRLLAVVFCSTLVQGLLPGQALFIRIFSDYGLYQSSCEEGQESCVKQELSVAAAFNMVQAFTLFSQMPAGYFFDRFGGQRTCCIGGCCTVLGLLILQIPLWGIEYGKDDLTSRLFPLAIIFSDAGNMFSTFSCVSFVYHFPNSQMLLMSLMVVQSQACALLPNVLLYLQQQFQLDLPELFGMLAFVELGATISLAILVPTKKEYNKRAKAIMGGALPPKSKGLLSDLKQICKTMRIYWSDHAFFTVAMTTYFTFSILFQSLVGTYGELLWGSQKAGDDLAALLTMLQGTVGLICNVTINVAADSAGTRSFYVVAAIIDVLLLSFTLNIMGTSYSQQAACVLSTVILMTLAVPLSMKYCLAYSPPSQIGTFNGVIWTLITIGLSVELPIFLSFLPGMDTAVSMGTMLAISSSVGMIGFTYWFVRQFIKGLPKKPPMAVGDKDDGSLTQAFL